MTLMYVPAGEFLMGSADGDSDAVSDEKPQHKITLDAYWVDRTEVTNAMFAKFVAASGYETDAEKAGKAWIFDPTSKGWQETAGANWQHPNGSGSDRLDQHPAVQVSWNDAVAYCTWAGRRLPTEAEWEKAARGTHGRKFPWGDESVTGDRLNSADRNLDADWADKSIDDGYQFTAPAESYPAGASPYRALNMAGNVWEWVADQYDERYYVSSPMQNPTGPVLGQFRVLRGGSWSNVQVQGVFRASDRRGDPPVNRSADVGFRCARSVGTGVPVALATVTSQLPAAVLTNKETLLPTNTVPAPTATLSPTATSKPSVATSRPVPLVAVATIEPTPSLGIGSTMLSEQDGMTLVYVPAGEFLMGSADSDVEASSHEKPQHTVTLDAFWIDRTEVTKDQYQKCMAAGECAAPICSVTDLGDHPVVCVSWQDAATYCAWAGRRLPTEAEWEKAARGTDGRKFPWGNNAVAENLLNFCDSNCTSSGKDNSVNDGYGETAPVGHYPAGASPYGALDMAGNVCEWVADGYDEKYYASSPAQNPKGPDSGQYRVLRGGSLSDGQWYVRAAVRNWGVPDVWGVNIGFRCARS
jgi:formylglycine-generating enzyme required for sulfatase activity